MDLRGAKLLTLDVPRISSSRYPRDGIRRELWIRTTAGATEGFGHLRRSLILARQLAPAFNPLFLLDFGDREACGIVAEQGWELLDFREGRGLPLHRKPSLVLFDTRRTEGTDAVVLALRGARIPVASLHDMGLGLLPSNLLVDGSILPVSPEAVPSSALSFRGPAYLVLDPSFAAAPVPGKRISPRIERVHISLGGGDSSAFFHRILKGLRLLGRPIDVIAQPGFVPANRRALTGAELAPVRFRWADPAERTADLLAVADLAISAGGLSAYEALASGTPLLALAHDEHQQRTVTEIARRRACVDLGRGAEIVPAELCRRIGALDSSPALRQELAQSGRSLVDGRGVFRVSRLLQLLAGTVTGEPEGAL